MSVTSGATLPGNVRPVRYDLTLTTDLNEFAFRGEEAVDIEVLESTSTITLNCAEIAIQGSKVVLPDGTSMDSRPAVLDDMKETATLLFDSPLPIGPAKLQITFTGELHDKLRGYYRSRYTDAEGRQRFLATTQFEATDARRAFPCWDEPALKATFAVTLEFPSDLVAVSNMPVASETQTSSGTRRVRFAETPRMSTYLLAFAVGDLKSIEQRADDGTLVRVWATSGHEHKGRFALETAVKLLAYFNDYFGIPYPLEKLDHLAIPDFAAGAMENWGAITYRETALLVDPEHSSAGTREVVASIVAHEMAHMWFGDLVTMEWWNDLWLNESFASWMGDKAVDHLFPDWQMWTQFLVADTNRALSLDGLKNSHPIEQEVNDPAQIGQLFDAISYSKGASLLRMLEHFVGPEAFRQGLQHYLTEHQYGNARTYDLWNALGEASGQPVAAMMDTWTKQTGYPVVDVRTERGPGGVKIMAEQRRFLYEHVAEPQGEDSALWHVALAVRAAESGQQASTLMDGRNAGLHLAVSDRPNSNDWIKVNPGQTGFYRVSYPPDELDRLKDPIGNLTLPAADRLGIQNDAYALSKAGLLGAAQFLGLAEAYANETDASVWADLAANLGSLDRLLMDEPYHGGYQAFARSIFQPIGRSVGWDARPGEGHLDALLRSTVLEQLGRYEDGDVLAEARERFNAYVEEPSAVHPDLRRAVLALAAQRGDRRMYDTLWDLVRSAPLQEEKVRLLAALTQFSQEELIEETLRRSLTDDVRPHETINVVVGVAASRHGRESAWEFVKQNWAEFDRRYGEGGFGLMNLVSITSVFTTAERLEDVATFFEAHPAPAAERTVRQSLERIRLNVAWLRINGPELADWFPA